MSKKKSFWHNGDSIVFMELPEGRLYSTYSLIARNRFRWENLPPELDSHIIEDYLYNCGQVAFFKDEKMGGFITLPCSQNGQLNVYGEPLNFQATGVNYSKSLSIDEMVWIKSNDDCNPVRDEVLFYTKWIDDIERTMTRNLQQLRQPYIVGTDKDNELSMKNMMEQIENGENAIYVQKEKGYNGEVAIKVAQLGVQNHLESLQKNKNDIMYELLTFLGINNANTSKKERMIVDEVNVNNINILMNLDYEYKNRIIARDNIRKMFPELKDIDVKLVIEELQDSFMNNPMENENIDKEENENI